MTKNARDLSTEELTKFVEEHADEKITFSDAENSNVTQFIREYVLGAGENPVSIHYIYDVYSTWIESREIKLHTMSYVSRLFGKFFNSTRRNGYRWFYLNEDAFGGFNGKKAIKHKGRPCPKKMRQDLLNTNYEERSKKQGSKKENEKK